MDQNNPKLAKFTLSKKEIDKILNINDEEEFVFELWKHYLPDILEILELCEKYPSFNTLFEKFKTMYNLLKEEDNNS